VSSGTSPLVHFIRELRRRRVFRTGALYVVGAWLTLQIGDVLFPGFGIPDAAIQVIVWTAIAGLPIALVFGWMFDLSPTGIKRTPPAEGEIDPASLALRRSDYVILAAFAAVAAVLVSNAVRDVLTAPADRIVADAPQQKLENSIAVLPFTNISEDPANEYFCDGISEEILNTLAAFQDLTVIGRTSSFAFKGSDYRIPRITALLGVRYVLQGSVRKYGNELRIATQLLDENGVQIWAKTFDRELRDVFEIQSEVANAVATTVAAQLAPAAPKSNVPGLAAYETFLVGREKLHQRDVSAAIEALERAVELDPSFAEAWAELAIAGMVWRTTAPRLDQARERIDRALALEPRLLRARAARGLWYLQQTPPNGAAAEVEFNGVLAQDPNMSDALLWLSIALGEQGRRDESFAILERAARIDPLHPSISSNLISTYVRRGRADEAQRLLQQMLGAPKPSLGAFLAARAFARTTGRLIYLHEIAQRMSLDGVVPNHWSMAMSYGLQGNWPMVEYWVERSMRDFPDDEYVRFYRTVLPQMQADYPEALRRFRARLAGLSLQPEDVPSGVPWYGVLLSRAGEHAAANEVLEPLIPPDDPRRSLFNEPALSLSHALAWAYLRGGRQDQAMQLLAKLEQDCRDEGATGESASQDIHHCAETALLRGDPDVALQRLEQAVDAGWRDYYLRVNDPYWAPLHDHPRYRELMARVKADVDRQAAEIARRYPEEDFVAKLDAAMAKRSSGAGG
jgi:TolB-like protein/cytochrome c-type biogenesis protein CcmH/NrfG